MAKSIERPLRHGPARAKVSVAEFLARLRAGVLPGGPRSELVAGRVEVAPLPRPREVAAVVALASRMEPLLPAPAVLAFRPALRLGDADLLRPDLALLDGAARFSRAASRAGSETLLVVEVLRGPASVDTRLPRFAAGGVAETWLLDLDRAWVEVYRAPSGDRYGSRTLWYPGERVAPLALEGALVEVLGRL